MVCYILKSYLPVVIQTSLLRNLIDLLYTIFYIIILFVSFYFQMNSLLFLQQLQSARRAGKGGKPRNIPIQIVTDPFKGIITPLPPPTSRKNRPLSAPQMFVGVLPAMNNSTTS